MVPPLTPFASEHLAALAERIGARADAGKVVRLKPETARYVRDVLRAQAALPNRAEVVALLCPYKDCHHRRDGRSGCYDCVGRANAMLDRLSGVPEIQIEKWK